MAKSKEIATQEQAGTELAGFQGTTSLAERNDRVGQGSQNVSHEDLATPRIKLIQQISEEVQPGHPNMIEGAQAGMFFNSVTRELMTSLYVINLHFSRAVVVWKKRKLGGGIFGTFPDQQTAEVALQEAGEPAENFDISTTPTHLVMPVDPESGEPQRPALMDFPGVKAKKSKQWNSMIADAEQAGQPRFSVIWCISAVGESNNEGSYMNVNIEKIIEAPDAIYQAAARAYDTFFGVNTDKDTGEMTSNEAA